MSGLGGILGAYGSEDEGSEPKSPQEPGLSAERQQEGHARPQADPTDNGHANDVATVREIREQAATEEVQLPTRDVRAEREVMEPGGPQEEEPERKKPGAPEHGLWLRDCAPGECLPDIVARLAEMKSAAEEGRGVFAERLRQSREMRDPGLFDTLVGHWGLNQTCSTIPADVWDPNAMDARNTLAGLLEEEKVMREKQEQSREKLRTTLAKPAAADTVPGGNKTGVTLNMAGIRAIQQAKELAMRVAQEQTNAARKPV